MWMSLSCKKSVLASAVVSTFASRLSHSVTVVGLYINVFIELFAMGRYVLSLCLVHFLATCFLFGGIHSECNLFLPHKPHMKTQHAYLGPISNLQKRHLQDKLFFCAFRPPNLTFAGISRYPISRYTFLLFVSPSLVAV